MLFWVPVVAIVGYGTVNGTLNFTEIDLQPYKIFKIMRVQINKARYP